jgi:hypothetical protein
MVIIPNEWENGQEISLFSFWEGKNLIRKSAKASFAPWGPRTESDFILRLLALFPP